VTEVLQRTMTKNLASLLVLMVLLSTSACTLVMWDNPISAVEQSKCDNRLPGAWEEVDLEKREAREVLWVGKPVDGWMSFAYLQRILGSQGTSTEEKVEENRIFGKAYVSRLAGRTFLNVSTITFQNGSTIDENEKRLPFLILEYEIAHGRLNLYFPQEDFVKKAIESQHLRASAEESDKGLLIHCESKEIREFIRRSPREQLFPRDMPSSDYIRKIR
jgi:hypothetical protein